jgi:hypothetical protein
MQASLSRTRLVPRTDGVATTAAAGTNGAAANLSVAAVAGDD